MRLKKRLSVKLKLTQSVLVCLGVLSAAVAVFCGAFLCHVKYKLHQNRETVSAYKSWFPIFLTQKCDLRSCDECQ